MRRTAPSTGSTCLHQLFEQQAAERPTAGALATGTGDLSYGELNRRANRLAHRLRRQGVGPDRPVGLLLERSADFIAAALAVLKAGGCYVPLDPGYPPSRLTAMLRDVRPVVVLTHEATDKQPACRDITTLRVEDAVASCDDDSDPDVAVSPDHLAYVMFTSGSSGQPKGVMVPHRGVVRLAQGVDYAGLGGEAVVTQLASVSFDGSTFEIWGTLLAGGRLVLGPDRMDSLTQLAEIVGRHGVTAVFLTTSLFHLVADVAPTTLRGVRWVVTGGDALSPRRLARFHAAVPDCTVVNGYGPTENTVFTTRHSIPGDGPSSGATGAAESVPIGTALRGTYVRVLDEAMRPVPQGAAGQLFAGGDGLARGYLNRPGRTAESFVPDPLGGPGSRLYATGDLVRELADGKLEFVGRLDRQVKIRGYRVEPGEIEAELRRHTAVRDVLVAATGETADDRCLSVFIVLDRTATAADVRAWLAERLPQHLIPTRWLELDALPLGPHGKVDLAALRNPVFGRG